MTQPELHGVLTPGIQNGQANMYMHNNDTANKQTREENDADPERAAAAHPEVWEATRQALH